MRISQQIGWSQESKLIYNILKQLDRLEVVWDHCCTTTTTSTTTLDPGLTMAVANNARFDSPEYIVGDPNSDFTIEWWAKMTDDNGHPRAWSVGSWPNAAHAVSIEGGQFYYWINGTIVSATDISGYTYIGEWTHFCIIREFATVYIFINGIRFAGGFAFSSAIPTNGFPLYLGSEGNDSVCNALMSNFRWVTGSLVYDPDGFTPPTTPLTAIPGTQLLILQGDSLPLEITDNSGMSNPVANNSGVYNSDNPFVGYQGSIQFGTI